MTTGMHLTVPRIPLAYTPAGRQPAEIGMVDRRVRNFSEPRLGVKADTKAGALDHAGIVRPVADSKRLLQRQPELG